MKQIENELSYFWTNLLCAILLISTACTNPQLSTGSKPNANSVIEEPLPQAAAATPGTRRLTEVDLTISGIRSGLPAARIVALLGKPRQDKKGEFDNCVYGYHRELAYDGLIIDILSDEHRRNYVVTRMEVTKSKWEIAPELHVGDPISKVRETFGDPISEDGESIYYVTKGNLGSVTFYQKDGKLIRAEMNETLC